MRWLVLVAILFPAVANACSCGAGGSDDERYERADAVLHGTVVAKNTTTFVPGLLVEAAMPRGVHPWLTQVFGGARAQVRVQEAWKADVPRFVTVNLGTGQCCDCTLGLQGLAVGEEVVLFGRRRKGQLRFHASVCTPPVRGGAAAGLARRWGAGDGRVTWAWSWWWLPRTLCPGAALAGLLLLLRLAFRPRRPRAPPGPG